MDPRRFRLFTVGASWNVKWPTPISTLFALWLDDPTPNTGAPSSPIFNAGLQTLTSINPDSRSRHLYVSMSCQSVSSSVSRSECVYASQERGWRGSSSGVSGGGGDADGLWFLVLGLSLEGGWDSEESWVEMARIKGISGHEERQTKKTATGHSPPTPIPNPNPNSGNS